VRHFIELYGKEFGREVREVEPEAMAELERYDWPGNIRELRNLIERAILLGARENLRVEDLPGEIRSPARARAGTRGSRSRAPASSSTSSRGTS
jgi:DNA-binding NtrC family response regulator